MNRLIFLFALVMGACGTAAYDVTPASVSARMAELSATRSQAIADGRLNVAARTFQGLGLATFGGDEDFLQEFTVFARQTHALSVALGGVAIPEVRMAASLSSERISWTDQDSVSVVGVGPGSDPMKTWLIWRGATGKIMLLVDRALGDRFSDVARRVSEPVTELALEEGRDMVVVLAPEGVDVSGRGGGGVPPFRVQGSTRVDTYPMANVVGLLPGRRADEIVVFSASRSHVSGTATVLELARYFASRSTPERTLVFVVYAERFTVAPNAVLTGADARPTTNQALEPLGPPADFGAAHFALSVDPEKVVALVHVDRVGEGAEGGTADDGAATAWITGFDHSTLGTILQTAQAVPDAHFGPDPYPWFNLFELLGNAPMAARGVPAHAIGTSPVAETDTWFPDVNAPERLDSAHMARVIRALAVGMLPIVSGEATPTRLEM